MKKLSYLLGLFVVAGILFSACDKDDDVVTDPPGIAFLGGETPTGEERVDQDVTLEVNTPFVFGISCDQTSDNKLRQVKIVRNYENVSSYTILDTSINASSFTIQYQVFSYPTVGMEDFTCTVWDSEDLNSTISFTVTTTPEPSNITTYADKILGAQGSTTGSSFASSDGNVYSLADAKANASEIDWLYYYGASNLATIAAPDDPDAATVFNNAQNGLQTWSVLNNTMFKLTTLSSADFNAIEQSIQLVTAATLPTPPNMTAIVNLSVGQVLAFETWDEVYGLIHIDNIITGANESIEITVKRQ